jgi:hypothetical protein
VVVFTAVVVVVFTVVVAEVTAVVTAVVAVVITVVGVVVGDVEGPLTSAKGKPSNCAGEGAVATVEPSAGVIVIST